MDRKGQWRIERPDRQTRSVRRLCGEAVDHRHPQVETQAQLLAPLGQVKRIVASLVEGCTMVSLVGHEFMQQAGLFHRVLATLHGESIPVLQTGDSDYSLSVLIPESETNRAVRALHDRFGLAEDVNDEANDRLEDDLAEAGCVILPHIGVGYDPAWEPEHGFFALDLAEDEAVELATAYGQNALVIVERGRPARLVITPVMDVS